MKSNMETTLVNRRLFRPHNAYNIYFILERSRLIHEMEGSSGTAAVFVPGKNSKRKHTKTHGCELFDTADVFARSLLSALF